MGLWLFFFFLKEGENLEELLFKYVVPLEPRTKKNHQMIAGSGAKCPVCHKPAMQFVRQGKANTEYSLLVPPFLQPRPSEPLEGPIHIVYHCYMGTKCRIDDLNIYAALDDILTAAGILSDDNVKVIRCRDGSFVDYDKENPRSEIYIYRMEEAKWRQMIAKCLPWINSSV